MKLNLGCGTWRLDGYENIDRKEGKEAYPLPQYNDNTIEEIRASHLLEHFGIHEIIPVLAEWYRVLQPGGIIKLAVPDFDIIRKCDNVMWPLYLMGGQTDEDDYHKSVFTKDLLEALLTDVGFVDIKEWESEEKDAASLPVSLNLQATKPPDPIRDERGVSQDQTTEEIAHCPKIIGVISMPRLAFTDNVFCATSVLYNRGIDIIKQTGAYWGQCLERGMEQAIEKGAEWIVTMDYDTVFDGGTFDTLCFLLSKHSEADAIAPIQMKREDDIPMIWDEVDGAPKLTWNMKEFDPDLTRIKHAHFGLTLFRVSALTKMSKPWLHSQPNEQGTWGSGRKDADISFWEKWAETGNTLYLANHVPIGHLQLLITWPDEDMRPFHQFCNDWHENGKPPQARK